jgi:hypothetical protein
MNKKLVFKLDGKVIGESTPCDIPMANNFFAPYPTEPPLFTPDKMTKKEWAMEIVKFQKKTYRYDPRFKKSTLLEYKEGDSIILTSFVADGFIFDHKLINLSWAWAYFNEQSYSITEEEFLSNILDNLNSLKITDKKFALI